MDLLRELDRIDEVGAKAWSLVMAGKFRPARRELKKIKNSFCNLEKQRVSTLVEAKIHQRLDEHEKAKERILSSMHCVWGVPEAFEILAATNLRADEESRKYRLEVVGRIVTPEAFPKRKNKYVVACDVIANSKDEAL